MIKIIELISEWGEGVGREVTGDDVIFVVNDFSSIFTPALPLPNLTSFPTDCVSRVEL